MAQDTVSSLRFEDLNYQFEAGIGRWDCGVGSEGLADALVAVVAERHRQDRKWANPETNLETFLSNLAEEFGEVAELVNELRHLAESGTTPFSWKGTIAVSDGAKAELRSRMCLALTKELIQTAGVAVKGWQQIKAGQL